MMATTGVETWAHGPKSTRSDGMTRDGRMGAGERNLFEASEFISVRAS